MTLIKRLVTVLIQAGLAAGFLGLGVLGIALIAMALVHPGSPVKRLLVIVLGLGGLAIAAGYVQNEGRESASHEG